MAGKAHKKNLANHFYARLYVTPRVGEEHNSVTNDSNTTCNSEPVKGWPESRPDSAKTPKISPELKKLIEAWPNLPEHIKVAIRALINTA